MTSQPRFVAALFGIAKTGAVSALINFNLRGKSLLQCIEIIDSKILVISKYEEEVRSFALSIANFLSSSSSYSFRCSF